MSAGLVVDLFAGGGGASTGIFWALDRHPDVALNHSYDALRNHALNHPTTRHVVDDIRKAVPLLVTRGAPVDVLWASPDCRHFSRAKGGKPCHPKTRSLPWEIVEWARQTSPRLIAMENVREMQGWGPLNAEHSNGCQGDGELDMDHESFVAALDRCAKGCTFARPIPELAGSTWREWIAALGGAGYVVRWWVLKACDYGSPTTRERLFIVCRRDGVEPVKPEPTHGPGRPLPYRTAAECIDWGDLGRSIFGADGNTRHAAATLRRVAAGVVRFVVQAARRPFLADARNGERAGQGALVSAFIAKHYTDVVGHPPTRPLGTITTKDHHGLVVVDLEPRAAGEAVDRVAAFVSTYYGQSVGRAADEPLGTITTKERHALVTVTIDGESYAIVDIRMRMLKPSELKLAQGFPASYRLDGSAKLQTKLIGNSVPPQLAAAVVRANTVTAPRGERAA